MKKALATNLRNARSKHKMRQKEAAAAIGLKLCTYQSYEEGRSEPSAETLCRIAEIFQISDLRSFICDPDFDIDDQEAGHFMLTGSSPLQSNYAKLRGRKRQAVDILLGLRTID